MIYQVPYLHHPKSPQDLSEVGIFTFILQMRKQTTLSNCSKVKVTNKMTRLGFKRRPT